MWTAAGIRVLDMDDLRPRDLELVLQAAQEHEEVMRDGES
jgi:hypothetical protein